MRYCAKMMQFGALMFNRFEASPEICHSRRSSDCSCEQTGLCMLGFYCDNPVKLKCTLCVREIEINLGGYFVRHLTVNILMFLVTTELGKGALKMSVVMF